MKRMKVMVLALIFAVSWAQAQTADEIVKNYFENTGGYENWGALKGVKMNFKVNQGGMEIPIEVVQLADGKQYTKVTVQGTDIMQGVYDGDVLWNTNFQTMKAEKADAEVSSVTAADISSSGVAVTYILVTDVEGTYITPAYVIRTRIKVSDITITGIIVACVLIS